MTEEPSVLDYVKAKLSPWRGPAPRISATEPLPELPERALVQERPQPAARTGLLVGAWPWISIAATLLALFAQLAFEPRPGRTWQVGVVIYAAAAGLAVWAWLRGEWQLAEQRPIEYSRDDMTVRGLALWLGLLLGLLAFWAMGGNRFTGLNVMLWVAAIYFCVRAFWVSDPRSRPFWLPLVNFVRQPTLHVTITPWTWLVIGSAALVVFFRVYQLNQVPPQMVSDHAEKLLDVWDVLQGETRIFFTRNTGRESLQMYLTAVIAKYLGTGISFASLKIGTVFAGLLTLPFVYLVGKEVGNSRVGLLAMTFAGIAYWPNVVARVGLRFPLYATFAAPTLYFLLRGIRRSNRNDFILAGLFLGIGLHGYTPFRIVPMVVVAAVALYLLHRQSSGVRRQTLWGLVVLAFISLMVFLPLLRYSYSDPSMFGYRAFSRLGTIERPLPGPAGEIFLENLWRAMTMFAWDDGEIWVVSVTHRPALDVVAGAFFHLGLVLLLVRYVRRRHWLDLFLLISIPLIMMPSILSLAYPAENPAINRASGALVPVFVIMALAVEALLKLLQERMGSPLGVRAAWALALALLFFSARQNYDLVFNQYRQSYEGSSWNTNEMGQVIYDFNQTMGRHENVWVVAYPHWVDTRLVGMHAGVSTRDFAIWPQDLEQTLPVTEPKLFLVKPQDSEGLQRLQSLYPDGWLRQYDSQYPSRDFLIYFVPPTETYQTGLPD